MNAGDRAKNVQEYYAAIAADRLRRRDDDFTTTVDRWLSGIIGSQPPGNLPHIIVRFTDCELVVISTGVSERVVNTMSEKCAELGYSFVTVVDGSTTYFHVYDTGSLEHMLGEYPGYTLFTV